MKKRRFKKKRLSFKTRTKGGLKRAKKSSKRINSYRTARGGIRL